MTDRSRLCRAVVFAVCAAGVAACSSASSGLSTASLLPGSKPKQSDPVTERALQVAATSARASKCGYNFDAGRLRSSYLAYETQQGSPADRVTKVYDTTQSSVNAKIGASEDYCTDAQTAKIKADLTRYLAGDFTATIAKTEEGKDWWGSSGTKPFDKNEAFCPKQSCI